jgi:DNA polymerase lambda
MAATDTNESNQPLADILGLLGEYYTLAQDTYRAKTFLDASAAIAKYPVVILTGAQAVASIPRVGPSTVSVIDEFIATGSIKRLEELERRFADQKATIDYFRSFYGVGPATAFKFYELGYRTLEDLWFKADLSEAQRLGIMWHNHINLPIPRAEMDVIHARIGSYLDPYGIKWEIAGSYRREEPQSGDVDVLVQARPDLNMEGLRVILQPLIPNVTLGDQTVASILAQGETKLMGMIRLDPTTNAHRIDIRLIQPQSWGAALMYFTGSQRFNILLRQRAIDLGMTLNEYGLYQVETLPTIEPPVAPKNRKKPPPRVELHPLPSATEAQIFETLGVVYLAPVARTKTMAALPLVTPL